MNNAAHLRRRIEEELAHRIPSALSPAARTERPVVPTGISVLDDLLEGGLPVGAITEIMGAACSGRTTVATAFVAQHTQEGRVCAWVDVSDAFDPESAAACGVDLHRLLWVCCGQDPALAVEPPVTFNSMPPRTAQYTQPAPRRDRSVGTPGVSNRGLVSEAGTRQRIEQISTDRLPPRRGASVLQKYLSPEPDRAPQLRCTEQQRVVQGVPGGPAGQQVSSRSSFAKTNLSPWKRLDQALRSTDLLLQAGGFSAIVLDMGSLAPEVVNRVPLATWFKFRAAAERGGASLLLLTQHSSAQSSTEVLLRVVAKLPDSGTVMTSVPVEFELLRQRFKPSATVVELRKPPQRTTRAEWKAPTRWVGAR